MADENADNAIVMGRGNITLADVMQIWRKNSLRY
jgi:hypothetical protein